MSEKSADLAWYQLVDQKQLEKALKALLTFTGYLSRENVSVEVEYSLVSQWRLWLRTRLVEAGHSREQLDNVDKNIQLVAVDAEAWLRNVGL